MATIIVVKDVRPDELSEARSVLLVHMPETATGGLCRGCHEFACHFAWWPCPQVRWAQALLAAEERNTEMNPLPSQVLSARTVARQRVYEMLLAESDRVWTVAAMAERLPKVSVNDVRTTLHLLLGGGFVDIEPVAQPALSLRLTGHGEQKLTETLHAWEPDRSASASVEGGDVQ